MAEDAGEIEVDLELVDASTVTSGIEDIVSAFDGFAKAQERINALQSTSLTMMRELASIGEQLANTGNSTPAEIAQLMQARTQLTADLEKARAQLTIAHREGSASNVRTRDGRTVGQAQAENALVSGLITGLNTEGGQAQARLQQTAIANTQRLMRTTAAAMQATLNKTMLEVTKSIEAFTNPAYMQATLDKARLQRERLVAEMRGVETFDDMTRNRFERREPRYFNADAETEKRIQSRSYYKGNEVTDYDRGRRVVTHIDDDGNVHSQSRSAALGYDPASGQARYMLPDGRVDRTQVYHSSLYDQAGNLDMERVRRYRERFPTTEELAQGPTFKLGDDITDESRGKLRVVESSRAGVFHTVPAAAQLDATGQYRLPNADAVRPEMQWDKVFGMAGEASEQATQIILGIREREARYAAGLTRQEVEMDRLAQQSEAAAEKLKVIEAKQAAKDAAENDKYARILGIAGFAAPETIARGQENSRIVNAAGSVPMSDDEVARSAAWRRQVDAYKKTSGVTATANLDISPEDQARRELAEESANKSADLLRSDAEEENREFERRKRFRVQMAAAQEREERAAKRAAKDAEDAEKKEFEDNVRIEQWSLSPWQRGSNSAQSPEAVEAYRRHIRGLRDINLQEKPDADTTVFGAELTQGKKLARDTFDKRAADELGLSAEEYALHLEDVRRTAAANRTRARQDADEEKIRNQQLDAMRREAEEENREVDRRRRFAEQQNKPAPAVRVDPNSMEGARQRAQNRLNTQSAMLSEGGGAPFMVHEAQVAADFMVFGAIVETIKHVASAVLSLDDVMAQFQAVTNSSDATIAEFKGSLLDMASASRYSVHDLIEVSKELAETGMTAKEVSTALPAILDFASSTGTSLKSAADILTTAVDTYGSSVGRMKDYSNAFATILNQTKLTATQLDQGLNASGETAKELGVPVQELTAAFGTLANAGLRTSASLGAGMNQLLQLLQAPTPKFKAELDRLGISMGDIDVTTVGLTGALQNLRDKGFGSAQALESMQSRTAKVAEALLENIDETRSLTSQQLLSNAATDGAVFANNSFGASMHRLTNAFLAIVDRGFTPTLDLIKATTSELAPLIDGMSHAGTIVEGFGAALSLLAARYVLVKGAKMVDYFLDISGSVEKARLSLLALTAVQEAQAALPVQTRLANMVTGGATGAADAIIAGNIARAGGGAAVVAEEALVAEKAATSAAGSIGRTFAGAAAGIIGAFESVLGFIAGPWGLGIIAAGAVGYGVWEYFTAGSKMAMDDLDAVKKRFEDIKTEENSTRDAIGEVRSMTSSLTARKDQIDANPSLREQAIITAQKQFGDLGLSVNLATDNVSTLIAKLNDLQNTLGQKLPMVLEEKLAALNDQMRLTKENLDKASFDRQLGSVRMPDNLGAAGAHAEAVMRDPSSIDQNDVHGSLDPISAALRRQLDVLGSELSKARDDYAKSDKTPDDYTVTGVAEADMAAASAANEANDARKAHVEALAKAYAEAGEQVKLFDAFEQAHVGQQGLANQKRDAQAEIIKTSIQDSPAANAIRTGIVASNIDLEKQAKDVPVGETGEGKVARLQAIRRNAAVMADGLQKQLDDLTTELKAEWRSGSEISSATDGLRNDIKSLRNLSSKALQDALEAGAKDARKELEARSSTNTDMIGEKLGELRDAASQAEVDMISQMIEATRDAQRQIIIDEALKSKEAIDAGATSLDDLKTKLPTLYKETEDKLLKNETDRLKDANRAADQGREIAKKTAESKAAELRADAQALEKRVGDLQQQAKDVGSAEASARITAEIKNLQAQIAELLKSAADQVAAAKIAGIRPGTATGQAMAGVKTTANYTGSNADVVRQAAKDIGTTPEDLATVISYETGGTFSPSIHGGGDPAKGTQGQYHGLIQFGPAEQKKYGVTDDQSFADQMKSVTAYLQDRGFKPGMSITDLYSTINAGSPGHSGAFDGYNTVAGHVAKMQAEQGGNVRRFLDSGTEAAAADDKAGASVRQATDDEKRRALKEAQDAKTAADEDLKRKNQAADDAARQKAYDLQKSQDALSNADLGSRETDLKRQLGTSKEDKDQFAKVFGEYLAVIEDQLKLKMKDLESNPDYQKKLKDDPAAAALEKKSLQDEYDNKLSEATTQAAQRAGAGKKDADTSDLERQIERDKPLVEEARLPASVLQAEENAKKAAKTNKPQEDLEALEAKLATLKAGEAALVAQGNASENQVNELKDQEKAVQKDINDKKKEIADNAAREGSQPTFMNAIENGTSDWMKKSGMLNANGQFKSMTEQMQGQWTTAMDSMSNSTSNLFVNLLTRTQSTKDSLKAFASSFLTSMLQSMTKAATNNIMASMFGGLFGSSSSGTGGAGAGLLGGLFKSVGPSAGAASSGGGIFSGVGSLFSSAESGIGSLLSMFSQGGEVQYRASGGEIGTPGRDSVPTMLMPGEFVMRASAVDAIGRDNLSAINGLGNTRLSQSAPMQMKAPTAAAPQSPPINLWVAHPDQIPPPGPQDIIHHVTQDMLQGGQTKTLVRSIARGEM